MKKLLCISHAFPPQLNPESLLTARTINALSSLNWDITVATAQARSVKEKIDYSLLDNFAQSITIENIWSPERILLFVPFFDSYIRNRIKNPNLLERQFLWRSFAEIKIKEIISSNSFDALYSRASPHVSNVVGLKVKRLTGLPWAAHFSDPWLKNPYFHFSDKKKEVINRLEKEIFHEADALIFTTAQTVDLVMKNYPSAVRKKAHVIPHGFNKNDYTGLSGNVSSNKLSIAYAGGFYGIRKPYVFFKALRVLNKKKDLKENLEINFIGPSRKTYNSVLDELRVGDIVQFHGKLPFHECLKELSRSNCLLVIDAPNKENSVFLPSKLIDYLGFNKPIIGLTPLSGASADLLRSIEYPVVEPDDIQGICKVLEDTIEKFTARTLTHSKKHEEIANRYEIGQTTKLLNNILNDMTNSF